MTETTEAPAAATQPDKKTPTEGTNPDASSTPNEEQQAANGSPEKKAATEEKDAGPPQEPPKEMRAVVLTGFGGFKGVKILKKPEPSLQAGEVLIRVRSCGLNFQDLMVRLGAIDSPPKTPCILGLECAGEVEAVGEGVENFKVGDRVVALPEFKAWAELVTVPAKYVYHIPDEMSFADAAAIAINYIVAYIILFDLASIKPGKSVLLHSAGGGVGQAIVQLARTVPNVQVFGVCSKNKHEALKAGGLIDHLLERGSDYTNEVRKLSPEGVDIVLDCLCGEECNRSYTLLKPMGKYILYGSSNVVTGETKSFFSVARSWWQVDKVSPIKLFDENKSLAGFNLRHLMYQQDGVEYVKNTMTAVFDLWKGGKIKPTIDSTWALEDVAEAMQKMHDRKNIGKLILDPAMEPKPKPATPAKGKAKAKKEASEEKNGEKEKKAETEGEKKEEANDKEATEGEAAAKPAEKENGEATESEKQSS
ncbi:synaptic vesicle membrane protein VAT-1 homolog-like [Phlebotomus papatasi]|uniref:synaptic vesicle membrane protein VAT-1 homolog-like n=1 Tax=Phlebotomus papatasi TaxID=29031 RepID=UPI002483A53C|nr:synaptic vesicle membrane protein VAT-1 homolog-like [Phlebotomus papatasi]